MFDASNETTGVRDDHPFSDARLRAIWLTLGLALLAFTIYGSLVPFEFSPRSLSAAWTCFADSYAGWRETARVDWGVNFLLFAPTSFCLMAAMVPEGSGLGRRLLSTIAVAAGCTLISLLVEFAQNWFPPRQPSLLDVAAQSMGSAAGIAGWWICGGFATRALKSVLSAKRLEERLAFLLLGYLAGFVCLSLTPVDFTLRPTDLWRKYEAGSIVLMPFSHRYESVARQIYEVVSEVLLAVPVGVLTATFRPRRDGLSRSMTKSMLWGTAIIVGIEILQFFVTSHATDATDVITGCLGVFIGVAGTRYFRGRPHLSLTSLQKYRVSLVCAAAGYVIVLLAVFWTPFDFTVSDHQMIQQRMSHFFGVPLSQAMIAEDLCVLNVFSRKILLFAPLGAWIAVIVKSLDQQLRATATAGLLFMTASLALLIEVGQIFLPTRTATFDDVLICTTGSLVGLFAMNYLLSFNN